MRIVILGYTGLLGESILKYLKKNTSYNIICVGRSIKKKNFQNSKIKYYQWDFNTFTKSKLLFLNKANIIINCVGKINNNNNDLQYVNVIFLKKLLKYFYTYKLKTRFINLSSVSVYGRAQDYLGQSKLISEVSDIKINDLYSKSKFKGDLLIKNMVKKKSYKNFSFTILRISNVFGKKNNSNLYKFVLFFLKIRLWVQSSTKVMFNFVNVNDVSQAVMLVISKLDISKNKIYIVSDDCRQSKLYKANQKKFIKFTFPVSIIKLLIHFIPLPNKVTQFFLNISTKVSYSNKKIIKELNFKPRYSLFKNIKKF